MDTFAKDHLHHGRPIIIEGLMSGQSRGPTSTLTEALQEFGAIKHRMTHDDATAFLMRLKMLPQPDAKTKRLLQRQLSIAEYLTKHIGSKYVMHIFGLDEQSLRQYVECLPSIAAPLIQSSIYLAHAGNCTHLHFDEHMCNNFLYQVFGTKRVILFPESSSNKLASFVYWSRVFIEHMSEDEKRHFVEWAGGYDVTLHATETLFIPAGTWHYVEYPEAAMSLSFRFGMSNHIQSLFDIMDYYHGTPEFLHIASGLLDDDNVEAKYLDAFCEIETFCSKAHVNERAKILGLQRIMARICYKICPEKCTVLQLNPDAPEKQFLKVLLMKGRFTGRYIQLFEARRAEGKVGEALGHAERFLSIHPTHRKMKAAYARLKALHPSVAPVGTQRISMLKRSSASRSVERGRQRRS